MPLSEPHRQLLEQQKQRAADIVRLLSTYSHILDTYVIEFFSENLWEKVPPSWQATLSNLTAPQMSTLLLERGPCVGRDSVWPLSLLAYRASAQALSFPRQPRGGSPPPPGEGDGPQEFRANRSQSSRLSHHIRRHVKPKKQHEIRRLGALLSHVLTSRNLGEDPKVFCPLRVVDILQDVFLELFVKSVGFCGGGSPWPRMNIESPCPTHHSLSSPQGHLSRYLAFGHGLCLTGVEAGEALVTRAKRYDRELLLSLHKEAARRSKSGSDRGSLSAGPARVPLPRHRLGRVDPRAPWEDFLQLLEPEDSPERRGEGCRWRPGGPLVLTGLHACGDLGPAALRHFARSPSVVGLTAVSCCYMKASTPEEPAAPVQQGDSECGYPMSAWVRGLPGHRLPYKLRELACHAIEDYAGRLKQENTGLRVHCYRAALETIIRQLNPSLRRPGVQTAKNTHLLPFQDYARAGLQKLGMDAGARWDTGQVHSMLAQEQRVVAYFCLSLVLAPAIESLILLDRVIFLKEQNFPCELIPLFDPTFSPRNFVLVAAKARDRTGELPGPGEGGSTLEGR
ncbi:methyltransferase-like protein 25B [Mustelus asterias]